MNIDWLSRWKPVHVCTSTYYITLLDPQSEVAQSFLTLCDPMDCILPGSSVQGIFQARILEWVAISFSRRSSRPRDWTWVSCIVGRHFTIWATREEDIQMTNKYPKKCSIPLAIRGMHIKTTMRYHWTLIRMDDYKCWHGCRKTGSRVHWWWKGKTV